jgi:type IV pilus assembly protein PilC
MAQYSYEIVKNNEVQKGKIYADSISEASLQIRKPGWYIVGLSEIQSDDTKFSFFNTNPKFPLYDKINFTDHLASAVNSGTPLQEALDAYVETGDRKSEIIDTINKDIQRGRKLSEAMAKHPTVFSPLYIALVQAGEISGSLDETLEYLATELRREHDFNSKIKSAMFYPLVVLSVSLIVMGLVIGVVIPRIVEITKNFGGDLPTITRVVVGFSQFLTHNTIPLIIFLVLAASGIVYLFNNKEVKHWFSAKMLTAPLVGVIMRQIILARFLRIVGGCVKYGIQLPKVLELSANVLGNDRYKAACENINKKITRGQTLSVALAEEDRLLFPPIISRTVRGSEKTSKVDVGLLRLSAYYEQEVDRNLKRLTEMIEPAMVIILGLLVAVIAISVIAPIYQMTSKIK